MPRPLYRIMAPCPEQWRIDVDEHVKAALKVYGDYLDGTPKRMNETIIQAIKTIREYVYLRDPLDREIHRTIIMAKGKKMSGAELHALIERQP